MNRHPTIQNFLDNISRQAHGRTSTEAQAEKICTSCGKPATEFKDEKSVREYRITGYCQSCQDEVFDHFAECKELNCKNYQKIDGKSGCKIEKDPDDCEILEEL
jgi:hypothetical protein